MTHIQVAAAIMAFAIASMFAVQCVMFWLESHRAVIPASTATPTPAPWEISALLEEARRIVKEAAGDDTT